MGRINSENVGVDVGKYLKWILVKQNVRVRTGFNWLRIWPNGEKVLMNLLLPRKVGGYLDQLCKYQLFNNDSIAGLSNAAPVLYFPGALFYSAGFNVNQNFKEKLFLNNSMFQFFS
jgi:hypothetical protein